MIDRARKVPLVYKVLGANALIVIIGAVVGTWLTVTVSQGEGSPPIGVLATMFSLAGGAISVLINYGVLKAALSPLDAITATAERVRAGDFSARTAHDPLADPQLEKIINSFNSALDQVESDRVRIEDLVDRVIAAQEDERKRIARELHDDTSQVLFAQLLRVSAMKASPNEEVRSIAEQLENMFAESMEAVRRLGHELRPPSLDDLGLREATGALVQRMRERSGVDITYTPVSAPGVTGRLDPAVELVLYRVVQEALTNMWKHAHATKASVAITRTPEGVEVVVTDNGRGFVAGKDNQSDGKGLGLGVFGMQERVDLVGGNLEVDGNGNPGTRVRAWIPS